MAKVDVGNSCDQKIDWDELRKMYQREVSRKQFAEFVEISPARVTQLQQAGLLHSQPNGKLNLREAVIEFADYVEHKSGGGRTYGS